MFNKYRIDHLQGRIERLEEQDDTSARHSRAMRADFQRLLAYLGLEIEELPARRELKPRKKK